MLDAFRRITQPACVLAGSLAVAGAIRPSAAQEIDPARLNALSYRFIGPDGNRAIAVAGEPGNSLVIYVGAASGGLWKTTDGGVNWQPLFDDQEASSVSAVALAPSEPNVVWAGTGETFVIRPAHAMGDGIYRSTDGGNHWEKKGLEPTGRIGRIRIDPRDANTVFACALGHGYGPQPDRGVYRTRDGGETWEQVLFVDEAAGCIDLAMDPTNPRILYASFWQLQIDTWLLNSGGPHSGVWRSMDGGETWERLSGVGKGLPGSAEQPLGKVAVEVAPSEPNRVYVLTEEASPGFYRSDDYGDTWDKVLTNHTINERAPYYTRFNVDPANPDRIYFASVRFSMSVDGGKSLVDNPPRGGGDTHDVWIDPLDPNRIMVADDGGLTISLNHGRTFDRIVLPIAQMYHVWVDNEVPYNVYGNRQDGWSYRGPSNSRAGAIPLGLWHDIGGCESGFSMPDPSDSDIVWSGCYDGGLEVYNHRTRHRRNVRVWPEAAYGWTPADLRYRWHWTFPIVISSHDPQTVYVGSQHVHRTTDRGHSWETVSPDLTLNDKSHQQSSGGVAIDNLMTFDGAVLYALAESPLVQGLLWSGSNDGQLQLSRDGGATWTNITSNIPDLPAWGTIANIEPSRFDAATAYISVDLHQMADFDPYIYKTTDYGESWSRIDAGIERSVHSFVHVVREDPKRPGMLWAGTDNSVWMSLDDGATWNKLRLNMPPSPVYWLTIQEDFDDLVVGTYGRGFYILDNVGPLRALTTTTLTAAHHVFDIRPAYRFQPVQSIKTERSNVTGRNPRYGADINYLIGEDAGSVAIEIVSPEGDVIRELNGSNAEGLNRVYWDLRHEPTRRAKLRTTPPGMPWVPLGPEGWRPLRTWDLDLNRGQLGPLAVPGVYTARIKIGEQVVERNFEVKKDPTTEGSMEDIRAQVVLSLQMRDQINDIVDMIDQLEWSRKQLEDLSEMLEGDEEAEAVIAEAGRLLDEAISVEGTLFDINLTGAREDAFRNAMRLYGRFSALANDLGATGADFPPTVPQQEVHQVLTDRLTETRTRFQSFLGQEVETLNTMLRARKLPVIISDMP